MFKIVQKMKELVNLNNLQLFASNNKGNSSHRKLLGGKNVNEPYILFKISSFSKLRNYSIYRAHIFTDNWNCYALSRFREFF